MNKIQELRKKLGLKQEELAEQLGIVQSTLSYWERGTYEPDNGSLIKLADFFKVTTDYILCRTDVLPVGVVAADSFETELLAACRGMNAEGRDKVLEYALLLSRSGDYKKTLSA